MTYTTKSHRSALRRKAHNSSNEPSGSGNDDSNGTSTNGGGGGGGGEDSGGGGGGDGGGGSGGEAGGRTVSRRAWIAVRRTRCTAVIRRIEVGTCEGAEREVCHLKQGCCQEFFNLPM
ncbi:MAG TPA: hypothetical protein VL242_42780 [Sorangium sp.]|nr:hypothetical protein [Sorangium sp.]